MGRGTAQRAYQKGRKGKGPMREGAGAACGALCFRWPSSVWPWAGVLRSQEEEEERWTGDARLLVLHNEAGLSWAPNEQGL